MADIQVTSSSAEAGLVYRPQVAVNATTRYFFYIQTPGVNQDLFRAKSTDGGASWGSDTKVNADAVDIDVEGAAIWFDQDTPGDTGTKVHCGWARREGTNPSENLIYVYRSFDVSGESLGTQVDLANVGQFGGSLSPHLVGICKARGGNLLFVGQSTSGFSEDTQTWRSVDGGTTWTQRADAPPQSPVRRPCLLPGNEADTNDFYMVRSSGNAVLLWHYDDSANTWTEKATLESEFTATEINGVTSSSDNHSFVTPVIGSVPNIRVACWEITNADTVTARTDILTSASIGGGAALMYDNLNNELYTSYHKGNGAGGAVWKKSADKGVTWGSETRVDGDDVSGNGCTLQLTVNADGGLMQPIYFVQTAVEFYAGSLAGGSVVIPPTSGASSNALAGRSFVLVFDAERQDTPFGRRG
mgnify:CR=1 FL=1